MYVALSGIQFKLENIDTSAISGNLDYISE